MSLEITHQNMRLHYTLITHDYTMLEVLPLGPLDGPIRVPYCLGSC